MMLHTPTERVANGARLLDVNVPNWRDRLQPDFLDIGNDCQCVIGQLFGSYNKHRRRELGLNIDEAIVHGFYVPGDQSSQSVRKEYNELTAAWKDKIAA